MLCYRKNSSLHFTCVLFLDSLFKSQEWFSGAALPTASFKQIDQTLKLPSILKISTQVKGEVCQGLSLSEEYCPCSMHGCSVHWCGTDCARPFCIWVTVLTAYFDLCDSLSISLAQILEIPAPEQTEIPAEGTDWILGGGQRDPCSFS